MNVQAEPESRSRWWRRPVVLGGIVALLVVSSLLTVRSPARTGGAESERLSIEVALMSREAYATSRNPLFAADKTALIRRRTELIRNFTRLTKLHPSAAGIRRLALLQHALKQPEWRTTLTSLRTLPDQDAFSVERELANWHTLLGSDRITASNASELAHWIRSMELGWYGHLAREALYTKTGQSDLAKEASAKAEAPWNRMILLILFAGILILGGLALGAFMIAYLSWARRNPDTPRPSLLALRAPPPLHRNQGEALYMVFLIYLVSHAVMQLGVGRALGALLSDRIKSMPDYGVQSLSVVMALIWLAIPLYALVRLAQRSGIAIEDIGLRSQNLLVDILWGVGGWMVALPLVLVVSIIAAYIFRGVDSPSHPAILELASSRNLLTILLLMFQASVLAPLAEELMFRGVFFRSLTVRMRWIPALVITSSVFAILHPQLPLGFFALFTLGAVFNALYALRGSLVPAITAHALNNTAVLVGVLVIYGS